ncbi:glycosyltransferase family 2 protein [Bradyrhizobium sp. AUGA SZCCT0182]|uniref:glycosyltransferase family 2 protein n=1 Tax=Bradyrhizobium sp. AUGA SZCCT0182 TaxID=2807667 RepID=UPI001BA9EB15|nr:glycosyltransferase family 2 protein [Bradyrhizobium sp. AUGA SZCCT0182]MBR1232028.1 glycosyltransferase [Bradyrhizobium sp. AUGA SZCCT0182]
MPAELPKISIVTPSFNQGRFIEANILSIQRQDYPALEHIVIDGGSTDDTVLILQRHKERLATVVSEKDDGQYHAINKGFGLATGDVMAWLNCDDIYLPGALHVVGEIFRKFPQIEWLTTRLPIAIAENGTPIKVTPVYGFTRTGFLRGDNLPGLGWPATCYIQQESTFWRRSLWKRAGGNLDTSYGMAGDFDLWARFFEHAELYSVDVPIGCFRRHDDQRTSKSFTKYLDEAKAIFSRAGGHARAGVVQGARIWLRQSATAELRRWAIGRKLIYPAPTVTYDWANREWVLDEC